MRGLAARAGAVANLQRCRLRLLGLLGCRRYGSGSALFVLGLAMTGRLKTEREIVVQVPEAPPVLDPEAARALLRLILRAAERDRVEQEMSGERAA